MNPPVEWLMAGEPWIAHRTRIDLLHESPAGPEVQIAHQAVLDDPKLRPLFESLASWPGRVVASHKSAGQPFHLLTFIADLGLNAADAPVARIIPRILAHPSPEGPFQLPMNASVGHGGTGEDTWAWALCDAPLVVYGLIKLGLEDTPAVQTALKYLVGLVRANGWPCAVSPALKFRGPGRKDDPCPFATLAMLKALSASAQWRDSEASHIGAETLLSLWEQSRTQHPYIFYMGTDFRKLKAPLVWYDLLHVLDVLSRFPWITGDARLRDMLGVLKAKADSEGRFTPESVWTIWKDWDFGQKRAPSRFLTLLAWGIIQRIEAA